ncbi:MAG: diguanylate cyclase [Gemmatimonadales bacterium]
MNDIVLVLIGIAVGVVLAVLWFLFARLRAMRAASPELLPAGVSHLVDLVRRAHGTSHVCLVAPESETVCSTGDPEPSRSLMERVEATARLAMSDGRTHVLREGNQVVAVGDGKLGIAAVLGFEEEDAARADQVAAELRRLLAELDVDRRRAFGSLRDVRRIPDWVARGAQSLEGLAFALSEAVRVVSGRAAAVVVRDPATTVATVVGVSSGTDRRLIGRTVAPASAAGKACIGDVPVVGLTAHELFGHRGGDRRGREARGVAFPLRDGREGVGALVVFGPHDTLDATVRERIMWLSVDAGPLIASAHTVRTAELRAARDELTGLANRRGLERAMGGVSSGACAMLYVDIDHFKKLNDGLGHAAGDQALKHVSRIFHHVLREDDVPARIGGEEFALWLPGANLKQAQEVAERVRAAVESSKLELPAGEVKMTCSVGVAAVPESVRQVANLGAAADAALYQAKSRGRNRVETAAPA